MAATLVQFGLKIKVHPPMTISAPNSKYRNAPAFFSTPHIFETNAPSQFLMSTIRKPITTSDPPAGILSITGISRCKTVKKHAASPNIKILSGQRAEASGAFICFTEILVTRARKLNQCRLLGSLRPRPGHRPTATAPNLRPRTRSPAYRLPPGFRSCQLLSWQHLVLSYPG